MYRRMEVVQYFLDLRGLSSPILHISPVSIFSLVLVFFKYFHLAQLKDTTLQRI